MSDLAARLRALPAFPDVMPELDLATLPMDPTELFLTWLEEAIASGTRQPHAMTFQTLLPGGAPVGRTLILKDLDETGFQISTRNTSAKAHQLAEDPRAAMTFFWRESGRQVQVTGVVTALGEDVSQRDWLARPTSDGTPNPDWQVYAVQPERIEFMQARADRNHVYVSYRREDGSWHHAQGR
ncbi:MAG: pyridoxine/pyridoxamine 5'-phosphate oxidase [Brachybacterium tyrofermentans]|uniref:Pyridoxal 5'-phosphate synthase n=1 Tax=Brachybacterium tyrofermentans TaxID=47848 RepID=A0ABW0FIB3_9MICO|nr:pyridoxamine 5'-phosphate oxidase family protein [Brachybacterium tyrofermentans]SLM99746.1 Pyridoxamine 5'-phosphate oxidase [Corynebacterium xerosis]